MKPRFRILISSLGHSILVETYSEGLANYIACGKQFRILVPEMRVRDVQGNKKAKCEFTVSHILSKKPGITLLNDEARLLLLDNKPNRRYGGDDAFEIPFMMMVLFEYLYEKSGLFGVYGAVVSNKSAGLLLGASGAGKSLLSSYLCKKYNYTLMGDDRIVLSLKKKKPTVVAGNDMIGMRNPYLHLFIPGYSACDAQGVTRETAKSFGIKRTQGKPALRWIFLINIGKRAAMRRISPYEMQLLLYRNISHVLSASDFPQLSLGAAIPSLESVAFSESRIKFLSFFKGVSAYEVTGSLDQVSKTIDRIMRSN